MATESVKILIEAEDKASAQIVAATKKIEGTVKATKDLTKNAKSSTEIFGSLAGALGGTEIGSFANQIGGLTGKLGEFSEIQKAGGAGSLAFKAGLVGVAGVIGFQVGNALGNVIFQTEKWSKELEKATERAKSLQQAVMSASKERFSDTTTDIELIRDPEEKKAAYKSLLDDLKKNVVGVEGQVKSSQKAVDEWNAAWQITGDRKGFAEQAKLRLEQDKERLKLLQEQEKEIQRLLTIEAEREEKRQRNAAIDADEKYLESLDKQISMLQAIKADETGLLAIREQAAQATSGLLETDSAKQAEDKLKEIKALQEQIDLEKVQREEKKKALEDEFNQVKRIEDLYKAEAQRLEEQKVLLEQGAEAAAAFRLEKQGLSAEDAKSFAKQQTELDTQKQVQDKMKQRETAAPLQAFSSRFLTRGPTDNKMLDVAKTQLKVQQEQLAELKKQKPEGPKMRDIRLVEVG